MYCHGFDLDSIQTLGINALSDKPVGPEKTLFVIIATSHLIEEAFLWASSLFTNSHTDYLILVFRNFLFENIHCLKMTFSM